MAIPLRVLEPTRLPPLEAWQTTLKDFLGESRRARPAQRTPVRPILGHGAAAEATPWPFMGGPLTIRRGAVIRERHSYFDHVVMDGDVAVASYDGSNLIVLPAYRRRGIGTELVADFRARHPEVPAASSRTPAARRTQIRAHRMIVEHALRAGLPVPQSVLWDYPDLRPRRTKSRPPGPSEAVARWIDEEAEDELQLPDGVRIVMRWAKPYSEAGGWKEGKGVAFMLDLLEDDGRNAGGVYVVHPKGTARCGADFDAVAAELGLASPVALVMHVAALEFWRQGKGLGVALYREAARIAMEHFGALVVADACDDGRTGDEAWRVWGSQRLREDPRMVVRGGVMGWRPRPAPAPARRRNPTEPDALARDAAGDRMDFETVPEAAASTYLSSARIFGRLAGVLTARVLVEELDPYYGKLAKQLEQGGCARDYIDACVVAGKPLRVFVVGVSELMPDAPRNEGLGIELYVAAARWAAEMGGVLAPTRCFLGIGTSDEAQRVWASRRFARRVRVFGSVAWAGPVT